MYYLIPLSYRDDLFKLGLIEGCEESKKHQGYYVPEHAYLILKNENLI